MGVEIERKFLVKKDFVPDGCERHEIQQGYLCADPDRTIRIRISDDQAYLTVKGRIVGISRPEFEYAIPVADAQEMMRLAVFPVISKVRHIIHAEGKCWEVDVFSGANTGLIIAEVELQKPEEEVVLPEWIDAEVTGDMRYHNSCLSQKPYREWEE